MSNKEDLPAVGIKPSNKQTRENRMIDRQIHLRLLTDVTNCSDLTYQTTGITSVCRTCSIPDIIELWKMNFYDRFVDEKRYWFYRMIIIWWIDTATITFSDAGSIDRTSKITRIAYACNISKSTRSTASSILTGHSTICIISFKMTVDWTRI